MIEAVEKILKENSVELVGRRLLLAVSGGADSMAMLHLFSHNKSTLLFRELIVCHFNHGLRGKESDLDEELVRNYCDSLAVPFVVGRANMSATQKPKGHGIESWARELRYTFLKEQVGDDSDLILTAHTKNDLAETVLFNLARGTGLRGVSGIPRVNQNIVRPMLGVLRAEIETYCLENDVPFRTDKSNMDISYSRNRIRHAVLPELELVSERAVSHIADFAARANEADDYLLKSAIIVLGKMEGENGHYRLSGLMKEDVLIQKYCVKILLERYDVAIDEKRILDVICFLKEGKSAMQLTSEYRIRLENDLFYIEKKAEQIEPYSVSLQPGTVCLPGGERLFIEIYDIINGIEIKNCETQYQNTMDYDRIEGGLVFRSKKTGDSFTSFRRKNTKSLKKLFNEMGVPPNRRDVYPILADDSGVVWIKGQGIAERVAVTEGTKRALTIQVVSEE